MRNLANPARSLARTTLAVLLAACCGRHVRGQTSELPNPVQLLQQGRVEEAEKMLLEVLRQDRQNPLAHVLLGHIAFERKDYAAAVSHFDKSGPVLAKNALESVTYAEALLRTNAPDAARRVLDSVPPGNVEAQFESGLLLARFEIFKEAEKHFKLARAGYREPQIVAYNLALAQFRAREFPECAATLDQILSRGFHDGDILNLLGYCYTESGQPQKALEVLKRAILQDPRDERNYLAVAKLAVDEDMAMTGLEMLDQGLHHLPNSYSLLIQRGYLRLSQGQHPEAESDYRKAITMQPNSSAAQIGLAFVLLQNQQLSEADHLLRRVIEQQPKNFFAYYLCGELRIHEARNDDAIQYLERAASLEPRFAAVHTDLGKLFLKKNDGASAVRELETSIKLDPEDTTAYYQLSVAYRKTGEKEKAQSALAQVRVLNEQQRKLGTTRFITQRFRKARNEALAPN